MSPFARFLEALHAARQREADRVIRRHWHLVEEANAYHHRTMQAEKTAAAAMRSAAKETAPAGLQFATRGAS